MSPTVYVLNGPNLNLLGTREPDIYGHDTLADIEAGCPRASRGARARDRVPPDQPRRRSRRLAARGAREGRQGGAAERRCLHPHLDRLLDAIKAIGVPVIEVHLSDPEKRETFRHHSYVGMGAVDVVKGLGADSYLGRSSEKLRRC